MITRVWIDESEEECVSCGACEACADAIFRVDDKCRIVGTDFASYETEIKDAVDLCPAEVLHYSEGETNVDSSKGPELMSTLAKVDMVEEPKEDEQYIRLNPDVVVVGTGEFRPKPVYSMDILDKMRSQTLTFAFAASVLHNLFPETQVFPMGESYGSDQTNYRKLEDVAQIRARWTKPSHKMHWLSPYDIQVDRNGIKYIMYIQDIRNKYVKTKRMKVALDDLNVGEFMDFVRAQFKIVQNNLSKKKRR